MTLVDLSHKIGPGTITYPGFPSPTISDFLSRDASRARYASGTTFHIGRIDMVANTGTYIDAPSHRYEGRVDISGLTLEAIADLEGLCINVGSGTRSIEPAVLTGLDLAGRAIIFRTGWSRHFGTDAYAHGHPFLSVAAAEQLVLARVALVGIDSLNVDDTATGERPVHSALLAASIPIVEHLTNLDQLPASGFRFFAVPPKIAGMGSFPIRAFAIV
ncbi:MAG TPA: cyclase family protein [Thermoanaerobaculia bacterium]|nr:cyclase family protein [Thermoanaerobaculia bacterium]